MTIDLVPNRWLKATVFLTWHSREKHQESSNLLQDFELIAIPHHFSKVCFDAADNLYLVDNEDSQIVYLDAGMHSFLKNFYEDIITRILAS